ncbi:MAG: hypothetical protein ACKVZH_08905 [Blastocatellia bacterium]
MDYLMLRNFDQSGYYETRLILMVISLAVAAYFFHYKQDRRFWQMFCFGVIMNVLGKFVSVIGELNGVAPVRFFGLALSPIPSLIFQGIFEGGIVSVFAFWYADLRSSAAKPKEWRMFWVFSSAVVALSFVVGIASRGQSVTWARPVFAPYLVLMVTIIIFFSLVVAWRKDDISSLASYFAGLLLFVFLNYEPMHLMGARFIGESVSSQSVAVGGGSQFLVMFLSNIFEGAGGKLHYFMLPFALGWVDLRDQEGHPRERFSTQHLADLAARGYRRKTSSTENK